MKLSSLAQSKFDRGETSHQPYDECSWLHEVLRVQLRASGLALGAAACVAFEANAIPYALSLSMLGLALGVFWASFRTFRSPHRVA
jgi:hypothetical protein